MNGIMMDQALTVKSIDTDSMNSSKLGRISEDRIEKTTGELSTDEKKKAIIDLIEKSSGKIEIENKGLEFSIHKETNQIMVKVIDNNTDEVIREVPSEKILDMMAKLIELSGSFIDQRG